MLLADTDETLYQMWMDGMCAGAYQKLQKIVPEYRMAQRKRQQQERSLRKRETNDYLCPMMTEDYTRTLNSLLTEQRASLLAAQNMVGTVYYVNRTGELLSALEQTPTVSNMRLSIRYPRYIRFLDLRRGNGGRRKKYYEPIYNKYVAGYLYGGVYRRLRYALSGYVTRTITRTLNNVD